MAAQTGYGFSIDQGGPTTFDQTIETFHESEYIPDNIAVGIGQSVCNPSAKNALHYKADIRTGSNASACSYDLNPDINTKIDHNRTGTFMGVLDTQIALLCS